jgi:hypothetical protein
LIHRDDIWKALHGGRRRLCRDRRAHHQTPAAWEPAMPYIEFISAITAVVMAVLIKPQGGKP